MPKLLHTGAFAHTHALQKEAFRHRNFCRLFTRKLLHRSFCTEMPLQTEAFTHRSFYSEKPLNRAAFTHTHRSFYAEDFAQRSFFADKRLWEGTLSTNGFYIQQLSHREAFARTSFYTQVCFHRAAFTRSSFYTPKL